MLYASFSVSPITTAVTLLHCGMKGGDWFAKMILRIPLQGHDSNLKAISFVYVLFQFENKPKNSEILNLIQDIAVLRAKMANPIWL